MGRHVQLQIYRAVVMLMAQQGMRSRCGDTRPLVNDALPFDPV